VSDALLMVKYVKSVCLVIQADKTPARMVQQACDLIQNAKAKPLGFILNRVAPRGSSYYYYSYSGKYGQYASGDTEHPVGKDLRPQGK
jgi:Mrp family chromosome partitioning ATPase